MAIPRTVTETISAALRSLGEFDVSVGPSASDFSTALIVLQDMLSEWGGDGITVPSYTLESLDLVAAQYIYLIGPDDLGNPETPDLDTIRPSSVIAALVNSHAVDVIGYKQFLNISSIPKSGRPEKLWYNPTDPNGTVYLYPTPSAVEQLIMTVIKPLNDVINLTDELSNDCGIPRNYHNAIKWNLALELCPEYGIQPTSLMMSRAYEAKNTLIGLNAFNKMAMPVTGLENLNRVGNGYVY